MHSLMSHKRVQSKPFPMTAYDHYLLGAVVTELSVHFLSSKPVS